MFDFNECKNVAEVKKKVREIAFTETYKAYCEIFGTDNVSIVGQSELAVCVGTRTLKDGTVGEVCFTEKPVAKDFDVRTTDSGKVFLPYERLAEADAYEVDKDEKERKAEEDAKKRKEKAEREKAAREKAKEEKKKAK